ncbi:hypothetical protein LCGC14_3038880, partial [marine sediment metagenome]
MADRTEVRDGARLELSVGVSDTTIWTDAELNRFIDEVTADFSRLMPREAVESFHWNKTVTDESFTSNTSAEVALTNKPIKKDSEVV